MTSISRTASAPLPGADLESAINSVLQETNNIASSMAQDVVESIKQNNKTLKTLRDLKAAVRDKNSGLLGQLLGANPDLRKALEKVMGELPSPQTVRGSPAVSDDPVGRFLQIFGLGGSGGRTPTTRTVPISDEDWDKLGKNLEDLMENFNAFGQEQQIGLQNVMTRVAQSFTALSNVSAKFSSTGDGIIGNIRG